MTSSKKSNICLLKGIFPIADKISISDKGKIEIDNPRTEEEINAVYEIITQVIAINDFYPPGFIQGVGYDGHRSGVSIDIDELITLLEKLAECYKDNPLFDKGFLHALEHIKPIIQSDSEFIKMLKLSCDAPRDFERIYDYEYKCKKEGLPVNDEEIKTMKEELFNKYGFHSGSAFNFNFIEKTNSEDFKKSLETRALEGMKFLAKNWLVVRYSDEESLNVLPVLEILMPDLLRKIEKMDAYSDLAAPKTMLYEAEEIFSYDLYQDLICAVDSKDHLCQYQTFTFTRTLGEYLPKINEIAIKVNSLSSDQFSKICFIGELLEHIIRNDFSEKLGLVFLVGIIDGLLTHNPDFMRFNVEDSITKQFCLKGAVIIHKSHSKKDLETISKELKDLYIARSSIVHGNLGQLKRIKEPVNILSERALSYVSTIIQFYLDEPQFIESLQKL